MSKVLPPFRPLLAALLLAVPVPASAKDPNPLPEIIERFSSDLEALERRYSIDISPERSKRLRRFFDEQLRVLEGVDFEAQDLEGRIDYVLLRNHLRFRSRELDREDQKLGEVSGLIPFSRTIIDLEEARRRLEPIDPAKSAQVLDEVGRRIEESRKEIEKRLGAEKEKPSRTGRVTGRRAAAMVDDLRRALRRWHDFYAGYHPEFTWWAEEPYQKVNRALEDYAGFLRKKLAGYVEGQDEPIIGDPIGAEALLEALESEMIPYRPEELVEIAGREFAWCETEMRRAAQELGLGDDIKKALERVKTLHVKPGDQPALIRDLALEATKFVEDRQLVTVPDLCKEIWRMEMMSPERQKVNPYFTGGEVISVSFPKDSMTYEDRMMSLRGNNIPFCRATVHHEVIPGHHLQSFMAARYRTHRREFRTPFLVEGWPLYWEMLLWDLKFPRTPEERMGMLFWRAHRCARIVFSLSFHLGKMSPQEAIDYLVEKVGHEPRNAAAEVRRSVAGDYGPLYQAAYLLGGLQLRALRKELVEGGKIAERDFHDGVLKENAIPIEMIRASLSGKPPARDHRPSWRFYDAPAPAGPPAAAPREEKTRQADAGGAVRRPGAPGGRVFRDRVEAHWLGGGKFWYRVDLPGDRREFFLVDAKQGTRVPAFDRDRLSVALAQAAGKTAEVGKLPIVHLEFAADGKSVRVFDNEDSWLCDLESYRLSEPRKEKREDPREARASRRRGRPPTPPALRSPDGRLEALLRGDNLGLREVSTGQERLLSHDANPTDSYSRDANWEQAVELEPDRGEARAPAPQVHWSPDSRWLVAVRTRRGTQRSVNLIESSPRDQLQPRLQAYQYLKPGDEVPIRRPRLFEAATGREVPVDEKLFAQPWSITDLRWSPDSSRFTFLYNQRGHQVLRIISVDARTGAAEAVIDERSSTFIDYAGKFFAEYLDDTGEIIWMSERDGWNHLYLYDARAGLVKNRITGGEWVVRGVEHVDREKRQLWFRAGGIRAGQDPYHVHYCRVNFDGTGLVVLTEGDGTHSVQFSPDRAWLVDTWSRVDLPPVTELRRGDDGALVCELERADASDLLASGWQPPERFVASGRDGVTGIYGIIHRPRLIDPRRKYPVIESIYAGPHDSHVPKSFRASYRQEELTGLGFIVVQIDGMGTSNRSKKFHDVCWKNLGDSGFPDRILWMQAAAAKYPWLDLSRVGIYGGSAGGQNAVRALLAHPDFYRVGAADCGCHDNRMDKIWWNELWMGWPVGPHYQEQSNVTQAHRLEGKLLLTVGELDRNVDPSSTMQLVNALIKADKDFDLLVVPGAGHGAGESDYGRRKRREFFVRHLLAAHPEPVAAK